MKIMSVDFGDARTGIAICDKSEMLASPLGVINEYNFDKAAEKVAKMATDNKAELIVVGHPVNMNGSIGERAEKCELFKDTVEKLCNIPAVLWDERGTTITAHNILNVTDTRGKKRKNVVDAVAATIILENYLQFRRNNKENE